MLTDTSFAGRDRGARLAGSAAWTTMNVPDGPVADVMATEVAPAPVQTRAAVETDAPVEAGTAVETGAAVEAGAAIQAGAAVRAGAAVQARPAPAILRLALLATIIATFLAGSSAPTPLYATYQHAWGFSLITTTVVFGVYALAVLTGLLFSVGSRITSDRGR